MIIIPTIKLNQDTKNKVDSLMANELRHRIELSKGKEKRDLFIRLVRSRFGITYNNFINKMVEAYTKTTK